MSEPLVAWDNHLGHFKYEWDFWMVKLYSVRNYFWDRTFGVIGSEISQSVTGQNNVAIGGSRRVPGEHPPLRAQILSFWHTKFSKRNCLGSLCPPPREILDPPLVAIYSHLVGPETSLEQTKKKATGKNETCQYTHLWPKRTVKTF